MTPIEKAAVTTLQGDIAALQQIVFKGLSPEMSAFCKGLSESDRLDFLAAPYTERVKKMGGEPIAKSMGEELKKRDETIANLSSRIVKFEDRETLAGYETRATACGEPKSFAKTLMSVAKASGDKAAQELEASMLAKNNQIKKSGLFQELGDGGGMPQSSIAKLNAKKDEIKKAEPTLADGVAFRKACVANPDLYAEYQQESRRRA